MARSKKSSKAGEKALTAIIMGVFTLLGAIISGVIKLIVSLFKRRTKDNFQNIQLSGTGNYGYDIVGESNYQNALESICGGRTDESAEKEVEATLILDDDNAYDDQAVRVDINGKTVGYLSRQNARKYRGYLQRKGHGKVVGICQALIVGGWGRDNGDSGHFGVKLNLTLR